MKEPKILTIESKKFIGLHTKTSFSSSNTGSMWSDFMPRRKEVKNSLGEDLFSIQEYPDNFKMSGFSEKTEYISWAAVEVTDFDNAPAGMECHSLRGGLYAVFLHKGSTREFSKTAQFIFEEWMPRSRYEVDNRAHFEILGEKYFGPNDPNSEEDVFIPIKLKLAGGNEPD